MMSEERWRQLFQSVPVGVTLLGSDRRYVAVNPAFQKMTGYTEAELRLLSPIDITHEDDRSSTEAIIALSAAAQSYAMRIGKRYRRKDGGVIWTEVDSFLAPVPGSAPFRAAVAVDITERKHAEEALRDAQADLERMARLTTMGELTASIAHEVNQPLAAIVTQSESALRFLDWDEPDLDEVRDALSSDIFPQDWGKSHGIKPEIYDSIINKTPLSYRTNRIIGGIAPSEYIAKLEKGNEATPSINPQKIDAYIKSNLIDPEILRSNNFEAFMEDRQKRLLTLIEQATGKGAYAGTVPEEGEDVEIDEDTAEAGLTIAAA